MARTPKKASKGKRPKKKIADLPAGKKAKGVKGGFDVFYKSSPTLSSPTLSASTLDVYHK